jgi:hypothetical protein
VTPCCHDGKKIVPLSDLPEQFKRLYSHADWEANARTICHRSAFVTTGISKPFSEGGRGFHTAFPTPPCVLSLQGHATHWLIPIPNACNKAVYDHINQVSCYGILLGYCTGDL